MNACARCVRSSSSTSSGDWPDEVTEIEVETDRRRLPLVPPRLRRIRGRASTHTCRCGAPAREWSYNHSGIDERRDGGRRYSTDIAQYDPLCWSMPRRRDGRTIRGSLTPKLAAEIRWLWAQGEWDNHRQLAAEFGVSVATIAGVLSGRTWKAVSLAPTER